MAELPLATATFLPFRSLTSVTEEPFGTTMASPVAPWEYAETTLSFFAWSIANSGGVLPTPPTSTAPLLIASSIGGPEVNGFQSIL